MLIKASGITDVGLKRESNEDAFSIDEDLRLYVVADGMGGHQAGEVASSIAVEVINSAFKRWLTTSAPEEELFGLPDESLSLEGNYLTSSIRLANRVIHELATMGDKRQGMGTTVAALLIMPSKVISANVGDSRIYLIREGAIERLSKDHTIVAEQLEMGIMTPEEANTSSLKHILTRNLGSAEDVLPEVFELEPANSDRFVLCTDGLTDLVTDEEILDLTLKAEDPESLCRNFVDLALKRGAHDNTTVVSVFVSQKTNKESPLRKPAMALVDVWNSFQRGLKRLKP